MQTAGTMNFSLTSSQLLDLASYQRTLKNLIATFAGTKTPSSRADTTDLTEVCLGSGAAVVLDTSVLLLPTTTSTTTITAHLKPDPHPQQLSSSQNYPLAFMASSQHPQSNSHLEHITAGVSEPNSVVARHKELGESDHQPTGLVGYIEHSLSPVIIERNHHSNSSGSNPSRVEDPLLPSALSLKTLKDNIAAASMSSAIMNEEPTILQGRDRPGPVLARDGLEVNETTTEVGLYDFGSMDDGEIFLDASPGLGMDDVHDTLWVH
ncbi:hypothetical protein KVV02_005558 [Mortierella alpina]|uniref:Uncharacterized protein n=1 Tax=Mortierella alpina TaxID=64518 RepID=A0A9P8D1A7_MORAP|nr:hypothetical protein KVV02_005558 [Mortierella alpina]